MELDAAALERIRTGEDPQVPRERAATIRKRIVANIVARPLGSDAANPPPKRIGNGVTPPAVVYKVEPGYSDEARLTKHQGTVVLSVVVPSTGSPASIHLLRSLGFGLDEQAVQAFRQWRFRPGTKDGQPVDVYATIEVNFKLL